MSIVTTFHGFHFSDASGLYRKLVYRRSRKIICVSGYEKSVYEKKWKLPVKNKLCVLYNGIDFSKLDCPASASPAIVTDKNALSMMMVGSFRSVRNQLFICKVADELNKRSIPFNIYFAGRREPSEPQRYDSCVEFCNSHGLSEKVHFLGGRDDVPSLLKQIDIFFYASNHDTFGIAVLEAMASAIPVVVNDWAVMKEITSDGKYATLYETDNVEDCLSKILVLYRKKASDADGLKENAARISKEIREMYSIENHIRGLYDIYKSCSK